MKRTLQLICTVSCAMAMVVSLCPAPLAIAEQADERELTRRVMKSTSYDVLASLNDVDQERYVSNEMLITVDLHALGAASLDAGGVRDALLEPGSALWASTFETMAEDVRISDDVHCLVTLPDGLSVADALDDLLSLDAVASAMPNYYIEASGLSSYRAPEDEGGSSTVLIGTGFDLADEDVKGRGDLTKSWDAAHRLPLSACRIHSGQLLSQNDLLASTDEGVQTVFVAAGVEREGQAFFTYAGLYEAFHSVLRLRNAGSAPLPCVIYGAFEDVRGLSGELAAVIDSFETGAQLKDTTAKPSDGCGTVDSGLSNDFVPVPGVEPVEANQFIDVSDRSWYASDVSWCSTYGVMNGYVQADGSRMFKPNSYVTRAEALVAVYNLTQHYQKDIWGAITEEQRARAYSFKDVDPNMWYFSALRYEAMFGVVNGYGDGTFRPNRPISRQEFAVLMCRALSEREHAMGFGRGLSVSNFKDGSGVSHWALEPMLQLTTNNIYRGSNRYLYPTSPITRAEMAAVLQRTNVATCNKWGGR